MIRKILIAYTVGVGLFLFYFHAAQAATNIFYSVGQSTTTNLMTGSSTVTIASGTAVFSVAQTGNIGVGDKVTYGASSSIAYISGKAATDDMHWTLITATGTTPANITSATVTSITRAYASLSAAVSGFSDANHLGTSSLVSANAVLNLPCYYDTGADTSNVTIPSSTITGTSTYINIFTPNNTSTQANVSQRHQGKWTNTNAYELSVNNLSDDFDLRTNYVRITGLEINLTDTGSTNYPRAIRLDLMPGTGGYIVLDSNIVRGQISGTPGGPEGIGNNGAPAAPTMVVINNIVYGFTNSGADAFASGIVIESGVGYVYNNTVYDTYKAYIEGSGATFLAKNDIAQDDTIGFSGSFSASSTNNISDQADAPGTAGEDSVTLAFVSKASSTIDLHLSAIDNSARDQGANLSTDPNYAFNYDIDGQARPYGSGWDVGADEWMPTIGSVPTILSFTMAATSTSFTATVNSFTATSTEPFGGYLITAASSTPTSTNAGWSATAPSTFTFSGSGVQTAYAWVMDAYGNISSSTSQNVTITLPAPSNIFYSVGQSTTTNLMTGSSTVTIASGTAVFSVAQTGNIGVGDKVTYGASSSIAYISGKAATDDMHWTLITATGTTPANITSATVTSITRAYASLSAAVSGFSDANHLGTSSLVSANAVLNLPCYYDTGADTSNVTIPSSTITGTSTYINIFTPNNTSTQANVSQRHQGKWTNTNAYELSVNNLSDDFDLRTNYVRITGLEINLTDTGSTNYPRAIRLDLMPGTGGYIVLDSNIVRGQISGTPGGPEGIGNNGAPAAPTMVVINNIVYGFTNSGADAFASGIVIESGVGYVYNNTVYDTYKAYIEGSGATFLAKNDIAQDDTIGFSGSFSASSTNNISDQADAPGTAGEDSVVVAFANATSSDFHLSVFDTVARKTGANLSADPNYAFSYDADGTTRGTLWDVGALQWESLALTAPTITTLTMPTNATSVVVSVTGFTATSTQSSIAGYLLTESSATPSLTNPDWSITPPTLFIANGTGTQTVYGWVSDPYGNISASANQTITPTMYFTPIAASSGLSSTFFGQNWNYFADWPSVPFGALRLWDNWDEYTAWLSLEPSSGTYNWAPLDKWLAAAASSGTQVLYTFGGTPQWASLRPTESCYYGSSLGCAAPPSDVGSGDNIWKQFVTALVEHSLASQTGHIKYYELWNEPNGNTFWTGTNAQLATMAEDAYNIIHNLDPNAVVLGPSPSTINTAATWLQGYYAAGGAPYQDAVAFHTYISPNPGSPQVIVNSINAIRSVMNSYDIGSEPLWSTEGSWATSTLTYDQQSAWLAQAYTFLWSQNVSGFYWYSWDNGINNPWGTLWDATNGIHPPGIAYGQLYNWLVGSSKSSSPCDETADATWACTFTMANGDPAQMMWNESATTTKTVSPAFTTYLTLSNNDVNTISANSVSVSSIPILLVANNPNKPVITSFTISAPSQSSLTVSVTAFTATESDSSIADYLITSSPSVPLVSNSGWSTSPQTSFTFTEGGTQTAYAWAMDPDGNISAAATQSITINLPAIGVANGAAPIQPVIPSGATTTPIIAASSTMSLASGMATTSLVTELNSLLSDLCLLMTQARQERLSISSGVASECSASSTTSVVHLPTYVFSRNLALWNRGSDVTALQNFLIRENAGPAAEALGRHGVTTTFGTLTLDALIEFQKNAGIVPASGYFGAITRAYVNAHE